VEILILLSFALLGFWMLGGYNRLVRLRNACMSLFGPVELHARERQTLVERLTRALRIRLIEQRDLVEMAAAAARQTGTALEAVRARPLRVNAIQQLSRTEEVLDQAIAHLDEALRRHVALQASQAEPVAVLEPPPPPPTDAQRSSAQLPALIEPSLTELLTLLDSTQVKNDFARQVYNQAANDYNAALHLFPTTVLAGLFRFEPAVTMPLARSRA
jgi:LemA protein